MQAVACLFVNVCTLYTDYSFSMMYVNILLQNFFAQSVSLQILLKYCHSEYSEIVYAFLCLYAEVPYIKITQR